MRSSYVFTYPALLRGTDTGFIFCDASHGKRESSEEITNSVKTYENNIKMTSRKEVIFFVYKFNRICTFSFKDMLQ